MKKKVAEGNVYFSIMWSEDHKYDKYSVTRVLPELPGIICLMTKKQFDIIGYLLFLDCWRDGLRLGLKNFLDPTFSRFKEIQKKFEEREFFYKYTVVDSCAEDMRDILFWLIQAYQPEYNNVSEFTDTARYDKLSVREMVMRKGECIEKFPINGF